LPPAKVAALSSLLKDSKGPAVELKVDDDKKDIIPVTVTTTPEAQQIIAQLIGMLQGRAGTPRTYFQIQAVPATTYQPVPTYEPVTYPAVPAKR
jgi:hypothetical protein